MSKENNYKQCQLMYVTLLLMPTSMTSAPAYIREFFQTKACDNVYTFSEERNELAVKCGSKSLENIVRFAEDEIDKRKAIQAVVHFRLEHQRRLKKALDMKHWLLYHLHPMIRESACQRCTNEMFSRRGRF